MTSVTTRSLPTTRRVTARGRLISVLKHTSPQTAPNGFVVQPVGATASLQGSFVQPANAKVATVLDLHPKPMEAASADWQFRGSALKLIL